LSNSLLKPVVPTLRGIIIRDDDDRIIVQATTQDVQRFAQRPGQRVQVQPAELRVKLDGAKRTVEIDVPEHVGTIRRRGFLYDSDGLPVARIVEVLVHTSFVEMSTVLGQQRLLSGAGGKVDIQAEGLPGVAVQ
jgi:hypothetical protein